MGSDLQRHPLSAAFGDMPKDEFDELVVNIKRNGLQQWIVLAEDGRVLDGWHRYRACKAAGRAPKTLTWSEVLYDRICDQLDPITEAEYVIAANAHRRHLTREQRRQIVAELLKAKPEASDRAIASMAKVDHKTVGAVRREAEAGGEIPHHSERVGKDGKKQPLKPDLRTLSKFERKLYDDRLEKAQREHEAQVAALHASRQRAPVAVDVQVVREATQPREVRLQITREAEKTETAPAVPSGRVRVSSSDLTSWVMRLGAALELLESWEEQLANDDGDLVEFVTVDLHALDDLALHLDVTREAITEAAVSAEVEAAA